MIKKPRGKEKDVFDTPAAALETFGTGEVAEILEVKIWRVQLYIDSPKYNLSPAGKLGTGHGSRRVFRAQDVYRLGVADYLVREGFSYKLVAAAVQQIEDDDLFGRIGEQGEELDLVYILTGGEKALSVRAIGRNKTIAEVARRAGQSSFYLLDLDKIVREIQSRMAKRGAK